MVDNSVLVPAIVHNEWSVRARRAAARDGEWIVPPLWQYEFTNVIVTFTKRGQLTAPEGFEAIDEARLLVSNRVVAVDQHEVLRVAVALDLSGYDAQYAALAHAFGIRCVTNDRRFADRARGVVVHLGDLR